jgi:hypothetical protein
VPRSTQSNRSHTHILFLPLIFFPKSIKQP